MSELKLTTVTRTQGNNAALKSGEVKPRHCTLDFVEVPVLVDAFRRMVRGLEFDVSEMAITTYVCAREHGVRFTALPIFLARGFHHGAILVNKNARIAAPKSLQGRRVGVNRGYTVTTGVWARGILQEEHNVRLNRITWVLSGDEHVAEYVPPGNVVPVPPGKKIEDMVIAGELVAVVNLAIDHPDIVPLIPNADEAAFAALRERGFYPINHLIVVKDDVLDAHPQVAADLFDAFVASKRPYLDRLKAAAIDNPTKSDALYARVATVMDDPLPYGIEPNRAMIEELLRHALTQKIIRRPVPVESLFAAETLELVG